MIIINTFLNIKDDDLYNNLSNNIDLLNTIYINNIVSNKLFITKSIDRKLLNTHLISQQNTGYDQINQIIKYITLIGVPVIGSHIIIYYLSNRCNIDYLKKKLIGILGFPAFELLICFVLLSPLVQSASILYENYLYTESKNAYIATFIILSIIPFPVIILCFWFIYTYIWPWHYKDNELHYVKNVFPDVKTALIKNSLGKWHPEKFENYCSIFYEHIRGPCFNNSYINLFRLYHVPLKLIKNGATIFIINCYKEGSYGNIMQILLLISLNLLNILNMIICRPLNGIRQQLCEILTQLTNLSEYVYIYRFIRYRYTKNDPNIINEDYKKGIYVSQKASLAVFIFTQIWSGILTLRLLILYIYSKFLTKNESNDASSNIRTEVAEGNLDNTDTSDLTME
jgi:hypothetical protein